MARQSNVLWVDDVRVVADGLGLLERKKGKKRRSHHRLDSGQR